MPTLLDLEFELTCLNIQRAKLTSRGSVLGQSNYMHLVQIIDFQKTYLSPFHAAVGIATCRMLMHLRKFAKNELENQGNTYTTTKATNAGPMVFRGSDGEDSQDSTVSGTDS